MDALTIASVDERVAIRIRSEYLEMPGLQLTVRQAERLFGLGEQVCTALLEHLVARRFLARRRDGTYRRLVSDN